MADIKVLPKSLAELIAAGEVVERPASVIKELVENAIDAGADKITVEIQRGGITYMRVTDNGSGIKHAQVPTAFLRHATSKITKQDDLFSIGTLGFRGEALASISSVARVELLTKTKEEDFGTRYLIEGGEEKEYEEAGCPDGTTIIVRDIFYNIPARMKFLKKDNVEAMAITSIIDYLALCNPEVSFKYIKDGKLSTTTNGDGNLHSAVYSVLGRDFAAKLIPVDSTTENIRVKGWVSKPVHCNATRSGQYFFLNGRVIRSGAAAKALDAAYKNSAMIGKFPACVLYIEIPLNLVDVNVHPAKTEVRFTNEKAVFDAVYYAAKNALIQGDHRPELTFKGSATPKPQEKFVRMTAEQYRKMSEPTATEAEKIYKDVLSSGAVLKTNPTPIFKKAPEIPKYEKETVKSEEPRFAAEPIKTAAEPTLPSFFEVFEKAKPVADVPTKEPMPITESLTDEIELEMRYIGEAFKTYIVVEYKKSLFFIDKHAAHERILFEKLKLERTVQPQLLISPVSVRLGREEHRALLDNADLMLQAGFEIEEFGSSSVLVRSVPIELAEEDIMVTVSELADGLITSGEVKSSKLEHLFHTVACKAAIKGGNNQSAKELELLAKKVLSNNDIMYCPHGRPVAFELKRSELERQFGRLG